MSPQTQAIIDRINAEFQPGVCPFPAGSSSAAFWHYQRITEEGGARGAREVAWTGYRQAYKRDHRKDPGPLPSNIIGERVD